MKLILQMILGGLVGFVSVYLLMSMDEINFIAYSDIMVGILCVISLILLVSGFVLSRQIHNLNLKIFEGEEEDEVEAIKYRKFVDYSLLIQSSTIIAVLGVSVTVSTTINIFYIVIGMAVIFIGYFLQLSMQNLLQKVYPERNLPSVSEPNYEEKLLEVSDEGERHVMLQGLYKSSNLLNILLVFAIVGSTIYSMASDNSQVFSIILMSIVLLLTNGRYVFTIRNK